jgi:hypothetical protein
MVKDDASNQIGDAAAQSRPAVSPKPPAPAHPAVSVPSPAPVQQPSTPAPADSAVSARPLPEGSLAQKAAEILAEEYRVLRAEIGRYQDHQSQIMNFSFLVLTGALAYVGALINTPNAHVAAYRAVILLYLPMVFAVLAALYSDRSIRILRMADYLTNYLRPKVSALMHVKVWQWEVYKSTSSPVNRRLAYTLDKIRWSVFILPVLGCVVLYASLDQPAHGWPGYVGLGVSAFSLCAIVFVMLVAEETFGVAYRPTQSLDLVDPIQVVDSGSHS